MLKASITSTPELQTMATEQLAKLNEAYRGIWEEGPSY